MLPSRRSFALRACACVVAFSAIQNPVQARTQAQLTATFKDRDRPVAFRPIAPQACTVRFTDIIDERRSPEIAGVIDGRGVLSPKDTRTWLEAVLGGLDVRGVRPVVGGEGASDMLSASLTLQTAWIASTAVTYSANVVVRIKARGSAGGALDKIYRGRVSRTAYWSGGVDTLQSAMDGAFADALDAIAVDLKPLCAA